MAGAAQAQTERARGAKAPVLRLEECLKDRRAWKLSQEAVKQVFPLHLTEVDGAPPGRFFPNTVTYANRFMDQDGHFLRVDCLDEDGAGRPCTAQREVLEDRIFAITALESLPCLDPETPLFDQKSWAPTAAGSDALKRLKTGFPKLWKLLIAAAVDCLKIKDG